MIVAHNHQSGDSAPSSEDREITERLRKAGEILGIRVLDSVVWTTDGAFVSIFDETGPSGAL